MNTLDAPAPLLPNLGQAFAEVYLQDFTMAVMTTGQQRTLREFDDLTREAGWKIIDVHQTPGSCFSEILLRILTEQVDAIEKAAEQKGVPGYPLLDDLPTEQQDAFVLDPVILHAACLATSAASQLAATLRPSGLLLHERAASACVPEILRDAGLEGLHITDIAAPTCADVNILGRAMRLLCTHYVFKELSPDVFAHNRHSPLMDTGKPTDFVTRGALKKRRTISDYSYGLWAVHADRYEDTNGILAAIDCTTDDQLKASAFLPDSVLRDDYLKRASFLAAMNQPDNELWDFMRRFPEYSKRFQMLMDRAAYAVEAKIDPLYPGSD
ncbi:hypothetical protein GGF50DRAFT_90486 [Schizophyllum commune]